MNDDSLEQPFAGRIVQTVTTDSPYAFTPPCGREPYEPCPLWNCCLDVPNPFRRRDDIHESDK